MPASVSSPGRVERNDAAVTAAVLEILADAGTGALTAAEVSRRTGMSKRPILARRPTRSAMALAGWAECGEHLHRVLVDLVEPTTTTRRLEAWRTLAHPTSDLRAGAELVVAAQFDPDLATAVAQTLDLDALIAADHRSPADRARAAYAIGTGLGLLWISRFPGMLQAEFSIEFRRIDAALRRHTSPSELPDPPAPHLEGANIDTGDPIRDGLLRATCDVVASVGFDTATTSSIAAAAGVSEGALFRRYPTKLALFLDATQQQQHLALRANEAFLMDLTAAYSQGVAEAVTLRQYCRPDRALLRTLLLEQLRVSWHDQQLLDVTAGEVTAYIEHVMADRPDVPDSYRWGYALIGLAVGTGMPVLAALHSATATYPFDVVTVPLEDGDVGSTSDWLDRA